MTKITNLMIYLYSITDFDFMGYELANHKDASFHHLILRKSQGGLESVTNGAVLNGKTAHPYFHTIERVDPDITDFITSEMIDMNFKGYLDLDNLRRIDDVLTVFEREHCSDTNIKGNPIIKEKYIKCRKKF